MKKNFTDKDILALDAKSDVELIESLNTTINPVVRQIVEALLNRRLKRVIQDLTDNVKAGNKSTSKYSKVLIWLTVSIALLTIVMTVATVLVAVRT